jgi:DNA polymerase-1
LKHLSHSNPEKYNWGDVVETMSVWERMKVELGNDPLTEKIYRTQSLKVIPGILKRQRMGIRINRERVEEAKLFYSLELKRAAQLARAHAGYPLNIGSEKQLKQYLYGIEGFKVKKLLGKATVNDEAIAALRNSVLPFDSDTELEEPLTSTEALLRCGEGAHPVLEGRVVYIGARQILTHFLAPMSGERFYPNISIHAQASGRWSIPPLTQMPKSLRDIIIPDEGMCWITWDWKSIEPRLLAVISNDIPSLEAFERGEDVYSLAAEEAFGWPSPVEDFKRLFTKRFVLRLNYGGNAYGAGSIPGAKTLGLTPQTLVQASQRYLQAHPALSEWRGGVSSVAMTKRETRTFMGRRRRLLNPSLGAVERAAFNHPMQGGVVDIANTTFLEIYENLPWSNFVYSMHDFQAWEVSVEKKEESFELIKEIVCKEWNIGGVKMRFPADFKIIGG